MSSLRMFAARTICGGHYFDFYRNTTSFMWDSVDDMTSTHDLPTHYRQLFVMFDRSTCEKVTNQSMLLLLALGWYHTAHRESIIWWKLYRQKHDERSTSKSSKMEVCISISSETRVGWQSRDKEPKIPEMGEGGAWLPGMPSPCPPAKILYEVSTKNAGVLVAGPFQ